MKYYWIALIVFPILEAFWDGYHELIKNQSPNYFLSNVYRFIGGIIFIALMMIFNPEQMTAINTLFISIAIITSYSWIFDGTLNVLRTKYGIPNRPYYYLGQNSDLDKWQINHGGTKFWFWIKVSASIISIFLFEI